MPFPGRARGSRAPQDWYSGLTQTDSQDVLRAVREIAATRGVAEAPQIGEGCARVSPAEIIELARAAARHGRRGPPRDYRRFPPVLSDDELAEHFFFDETDRELIARRRRDSNRLGFALQLGTVRYLGRFVEDLSEVSPQVVRYVAGKLEIADPGVLEEYARGEARWDHQAEMRQRYGLRKFSDPAAQAELVGWLQARAWVGAETHGALFDRTVDHLISCEVLLPGASVLWRLVGTVRERANERGWLLVAGQLTDPERDRLLGTLLSGGELVTPLSLPGDPMTTSTHRGGERRPGRARRRIGGRLAVRASRRLAMGEPGPPWPERLPGRFGRLTPLLQPLDNEMTDFGQSDDPLQLI